MGTDQEKVEKPAEKETEVKNDSMRQDYAFASDVKLKECKYCRVMIPKQAKVCPNCKMILKSHTFLKVVAAVLVFGAIVVGVAFGLKPVEPAEAVAITETVTQEEVKEAASNKEEQVEEVKSVVRNDSVKENAESDEFDTENISLVEDKPGSGEKDVKEDKTASEEKDATEDQSGIVEKDDIEDQSDAEDNGAKADQTDAEKKDGKEEKSDTKDEDATDSEDKSDVKEENTTEDSEQKDDDKPVMVPRDIDENEAAFRADCVQRKYKSLLRDEAYLETAVLVMEAEVICQVDGGLFDESIYYLCMEEENGKECYYIVRDDRETDETLILEGDIITVYGQLFGICKIPTYLVETRPTVPAISMLSFDLLEE